MDWGVNDFRDLARVKALAPVVGVSGQNGLFIDGTADQLEGAGPVGVHRRKVGFALGHIVRGHHVIGFGPALVHHKHVGQVVDQKRVGAMGFDVDGMGIGCADLLDRGQQFFHVRTVSHCPIEGEDDVFGIKSSTVVVSHALAQFEAPDVWIVGQCCPLSCQ